MSTVPNLLKSMFARVAAPWAAGPPLPEAYTLYRLRFIILVPRGTWRAPARAVTRSLLLWAIIGYSMLHWDLLWVCGAAVELGGVAWPILPELPAALAQL